jgi:hypothetical protein
MLNVHAKAELLENSPLGLNYMVLGFIVLLVDGHRLDDLAGAQLLYVMENVHDITQTPWAFFNLAAQKY